MNTITIVCSLTLAATLGCNALPTDDGAPQQVQPRLITISIGDTFQLSSPNHSSVGLTSVLVFKDETLAKQINKTIRYDKPERMKDGYTGGDSAMVTTIFKAVKTGQTQVEVSTLFRGELQEKRIYLLNISATRERTQ